MDFLKLCRLRPSVRLGGGGGWGNLVAGVDLIRRVEGASVTPGHTADHARRRRVRQDRGRRDSLSADLMSPYAFYKFWLDVSDAEVLKLLRVFSFR